MLRSNTTIGYQTAIRNSGDFNIVIGSGAGNNLTTGSNNIDIVSDGVAGESNTIRIGDPETQETTYIAGISGAIVPNGTEVLIDFTGHLGTTTSSAHYKERIAPMSQESEAILSLRAVTFRYKKELDPAAVAQFGLVAEEVEKVNPQLVVRSKAPNFTTPPVAFGSTQPDRTSAALPHGDAAARWHCAPGRRL